MEQRTRWRRAGGLSRSLAELDERAGVLGRGRYRTPPDDRRDDLVGLIETFLTDRQPEAGRVRAAAHHPAPRPDRPALSDVDGRGQDHRWPVAEIASVAALAERLQLSDGQLAWLADVRSLERTVPEETLRNYRYRTLARRGGVPRMIEAPKARLKEVQRWVLHEILDRVPAHEAAHGFTRALCRSATHAYTRVRRRFCASISRTSSPRSPPVASTHLPHVGLPAIGRARPDRREHQCHPAGRLARGPEDDRAAARPAQFWLGRQLATPHLPQGAPSSPALANLAAFRLDRRLTGLAASSGLSYSRYADDVTFSGPARSRRRHAEFEALATTIIRDEGFALNHGKSALHGAGARQSVCGIVVNAHPNVVRAEYDQLKAILHNAARNGPASQNRSGIADFEAHLRGRISWVEFLNPGRGEKLRRQWAEIDWGEPRAAG